jgi:hypothetical protein
MDTYRPIPSLSEGQLEVLTQLRNRAMTRDLVRIDIMQSIAVNQISLRHHHLRTDDMAAFIKQQMFLLVQQLVTLLLEELHDHNVSQQIFASL